MYFAFYFKWHTSTYVTRIILGFGAIFICVTLRRSILKKGRFSRFYHLMYRWAGQAVNILGDFDLGLS